MSQYGKSIAQYQLLMEIEVKKHCHTFVWLSLQCRGGYLIWASKRYKLAIVYPTGYHSKCHLYIVFVFFPQADIFYYTKMLSMSCV